MYPGFELIDELFGFFGLRSNAPVHVPGKPVYHPDDAVSCNHIDNTPYVMFFPASQEGRKPLGSQSERVTDSHTDPFVADVQGQGTALSALFLF